LVALTMTGELVDLFADRDQGVQAILERVAAHLADLPIQVYARGHGFFDLNAAFARTREVASANWHATAELVAALVPEALFVDCGSTTTDIVPVAGGRVLARGLDDRARLASGELVYQGVVRTPLCAVAERAPFRGTWHTLMNEWFATTADVYRLLGRLDEGSDLHPAADQGPKTVDASARRLARMIGCDLADADLRQWRELAAWFAARQLMILEEAARLVLSRGELGHTAPLIAIGAGAFIIEDLAARPGRPLQRFEQLLGLDGECGRTASIVAPALAVARLALAQGGR
jgi:probable H4MPT-linked C1 transfer pathway protein